MATRCMTVCDVCAGTTGVQAVSMGISINGARWQQLSLDFCGKCRVVFELKVGDLDEFMKGLAAPSS